MTGGSAPGGTPHATTADASTEAATAEPNTPRLYRKTRSPADALPRCARSEALSPVGFRPYVGPVMQANPEQPPASTIAAGTCLGKYQVVRLIGEGGMGAVYEGVHVAIGKKVAIKVMRPSLAADPDARA